MRTALIAISLCLALLGAAGCSSEEDREKERLRGQIQAKMVEYEGLHEQYRARHSRVYPDSPHPRDQLSGLVHDNLEASGTMTGRKGVQVLEYTLSVVNDRIATVRGGMERLEAAAARKAAGGGPAEAAVKRLYGSGGREP